jgi:hypothetical protein
VDEVSLDGTASGATVNVLEVAPTRPAERIYGVNGVINVGSAAGSLDSIQGSLTIDYGSPSSATLILNDQGSGGGHTYNVTSSTVSRVGNLGTATITYGTIKGLKVNAGSGANTVHVAGTNAEMVTLNGGAGSLDLYGTDGLNSWSIGGNPNGGLLLSDDLIAGAVSFVSGATSLHGGHGGNVFFVSDGPGIDGGIEGGDGGVNTLNYQFDTKSVFVNLPLGQATGVGGKVVNIQSVVGGDGGAAGTYNVLIGNGYAHLYGGHNRRNLLVAGNNGMTGSILEGGTVGDILIAGTTDYDTSDQWQQAFTAIMNEWTRTDLLGTPLDQYNARVDHLKNGGGLNDLYLLNATTVHSNGGGNTLKGHYGVSTGLNLYFANLALGDTADQGPDEQLITIV